jgi:hypothetical protein
MARKTYSNPKAFGYAKKYCGQKTNECGVYLEGPKKSDCAHFLAHCLNAGGIKIPDGGQDLCPMGLAVRNVDLVDALNKLAAQYENIKVIDLSEAIIGDVGFLKIERPRHAFMVYKPGTLPGGLDVPYVWAHSDSRCGEQLDTVWRQWFSTAFRLEDGP